MAKKKKGRKTTIRQRNLIAPEELNARLTPEERSENARKAGIASGKARGFKKLARELLTEEEKEALIRAQIEMGKRGSVPAFRLLMEIGDVPDDLSEEEDALSRSLEELARRMENDQ